MMLTTDNPSKQIPMPSPENPVLAQVVHDLEKYLEKFEDKNKIIKLISKKTNIHEKTFQRILQGKNSPNYSTVFKIYRYIFNENDDAKILERCPSIIKDYLKKANPQKLEKAVSYSSEFESEIMTNPVFLEIYVLCSTGPVKLSEIHDRFGLYGLNLMTKLISKNILTEVKKNEFSLGQNQLNISPETVVKFGLQISSSYTKPANSHELFKNFVGFFSEGLTEDAYRKWLAIDQQAFDQKTALANDPSSHGKKRVFTFTTTDTLDPKEDL